MKRAILEVIAMLLISAACGGVAGILSGYYTTRDALIRDASERAQAQTTFTDKHEATIEFPALVRGRRINCVVVVNTARKTQSIFC